MLDLERKMREANVQNATPAVIQHVTCSQSVKDESAQMLAVISSLQDLVVWYEPKDTEEEHALAFLEDKLAALLIRAEHHLVRTTTGAYDGTSELRAIQTAFHDCFQDFVRVASEA